MNPTEIREALAWWESGDIQSAIGLSVWKPQPTLKRMERLVVAARGYADLLENGEVVEELTMSEEFDFEDVPTYALQAEIDRRSSEVNE